MLFVILLTILSSWSDSFGSEANRDNMVFPKATEYLQPIRIPAKLCGVFPHRISSRSEVPKLYFIYSLVFILLSAISYSKNLLYHFNKYRDIICFTLSLGDITTFSFHASSLLVPFSSEKIYSNCRRGLITWRN